MLKNGKGTILFTGATASIRGSAKFGVFAASKFALRALAQSMARELGPQGVHVAHIIVDGPINTPRQLQSKVSPFLSREKSLCHYSDQPDKDIDSFIHSDAVKSLFDLLGPEKDLFTFRSPKHIGIYMFNLVQHGHKNLTFVHSPRNFKTDFILFYCYYHIRSFFSNVNTIFILDRWITSAEEVLIIASSIFGSLNKTRAF